MSKKDFTHEDTIAAIATAPGRGGIAVIRISGESSFSILNRLFKRKTAQNAPNNLDWESHKLYYGKIFDTNSQKMLDIGLAVFMKAPNSFTGQDIVEIHSHGGLLLPKKILDLCIHNGARPARPGEFSLRAFLNGKLDLSQAEAVADIVNAETEEGLRIAGLHLEGELSIRAKEYADALIDVLAEIEAQVDFPEEDIEPATKQQIVKTTTELKQKIDSLAETFNQGRILKHGINTAIIGKPNVGKSSLLNRLVMKQRAIVSPEPGTTRDFIEESISVDGIVLNLVDTAGIRAAKDSIEKIGVDLSHKKASEAELIIGVFDSSKELDSDDLKVLASMKDKNAIAVCNKIDLTKRLESDSFKGYVSPDLVVSTSAKNGQGIEELKEIIVDTALGRDDRSEGSEFLITELRHKNALERASQYIEKFLEAFALGNSPEFLAIDLHSALESISEITGEISSEAILDRVFSKFCIGK